VSARGPVFEQGCSPTEVFTCTIRRNTDARAAQGEILSHSISHGFTVERDKCRREPVVYPQSISLVSVTYYDNAIKLSKGSCEVLKCSRCGSRLELCHRISVCGYSWRQAPLRGGCVCLSHECCARLRRRLSNILKLAKGGMQERQHCLRRTMFS